MLTNRRKEAWIAAVLVAPFLAIYRLVFVWPTIQMFGMSFTDAPLIGAGDWVGPRQLHQDARRTRVFRTAVWNTAYFVLLTVMPGTDHRAADRADGVAA